MGNNELRAESQREPERDRRQRQNKVGFGLFTKIIDNKEQTIHKLPASSRGSGGLKDEEVNGRQFDSCTHCFC